MVRQGIRSSCDITLWVQLQVAQVHLRSILKRTVLMKTVKLLRLGPLHSHSSQGTGAHLAPVDAHPPQARTTDDAQVLRIDHDDAAVEAGREVFCLTSFHDDILHKVSHSSVGYVHLDMAGKPTEGCELLPLRTIAEPGASSLMRESLGMVRQPRTRQAWNWSGHTS